MFGFVLLVSLNLILLNVCSIINPTEKYRNTVVLGYRGVAKTGMDQLFFNIPISWFIHTPTPKSNLPKSLNPQQNQPKIQSHLSNTLYRTPYRKIPYFTHKFTSPILKINNQTFLKPHSPILVSSLLISTFCDTHFLTNTYLLGGVLKPSHYLLPKRSIPSNLTLKFNLTLHPTNLPTKPSKLKFTLKIINLLHKSHITNSMYSNKNSPYD